ncbi:MAG: hypothetical protein WDO12_05645 [Pseudomonadota bacterium]
MKLVPYQRLAVGAAVASIIGGFAASTYVPRAFAADSQPAAAATGDTELEAVVVTGSRITRRDAVANSPLSPSMPLPWKARPASTSSRT